MRKNVLIISAVVILGFVFAFSGCDMFGNDSEEGSSAINVHIEGKGAVDADPSQSEYGEFSTVTLTAYPAKGWVFSHWYGEIIDSVSDSRSEQIQNPVTVEIQEPGDSGTTLSNVTAVFEKIAYDLRGHSDNYNTDSTTGDFQTDYTINNNGNTTITLTSATYTFYDSGDNILNDITISRNTLLLPQTLHPGEGITFHLEGTSANSYASTFDIAFTFTDEFDNHSSSTVSGVFY